MLELYILLIFMIIGALVALQSKDLLSSVVALGAVGLSLSLTFLILKAPDLALTQLVVELLSLIILIRATLKKGVPPIPTGGWRYPTAMGVGFAVVLTLVAFHCFPDLPTFGEPRVRVAQHYVDSGVRETGATNLVAAVILDYRAFDTLGEATVLFTTAIGVLAVTRRVGRKQRHQSDREGER
ncbi:MAG: hydrogen gas-evolving membrane-bound hydrogenase subunit E [Candidatus Binatia bacterium]